MHFDKDHISFYLAVLAAIGSLAGVMIGGYLSERIQHKQWLRGNRKEEFKDVVTALASATIEFLAFTTTKDEAQLAKFRDAQKSALLIMRNRIYIANDLWNLKLTDRYLAIAGQIGEDPGNPERVKGIDRLIDEIVGLAIKE
jgi:hypothetical protein